MNRYRLAALIDNVPNTLVGDTRPYALRIADAILAAFEVVDLPYAENYGEGDQWTTGAGTVSISDVESVTEIWFEKHANTIEHTRELAAALLAAAKTAEARS